MFLALTYLRHKKIADNSAVMNMRNKYSTRPQPFLFIMFCFFNEEGVGWVEGGDNCSAYSERENIRVAVGKKQATDGEDCTLIYPSRKNCSHSPMNNDCHNNSGERETGKCFSLCMYLQAYEPSNKQTKNK